MARDPRARGWPRLLNTFGDTTACPRSLVPTAGSTTAKLMPNAINFGPAMPGKKYTAHKRQGVQGSGGPGCRHADVHRDAGAHWQPAANAVSPARLLAWLFNVCLTQAQGIGNG